MKNLPVPQASLAVTVTFVVLPLLVSFLLWFFYRRGRHAESAQASSFGFGVALFLWLWVTAGISLSGVLTRFDMEPPPFAILIAATFALSVYAGFSHVGATLARVPLAWLVGLNAFRLPLELAMHEAARQRVMPEQMSFTGWNFDILTGVSALLLSPLIASGRVSRAMVAVWNAAGALLLANVVTIALLSTPVIRAFGKGRHMNTFVAFFPYVWLPAVLVAAAIILHIVIWRVLREAPPRPVA
jgi:hypothetical protein